MMLARMDAANESVGQSLVRQLARAFSGIAAEAVRETALAQATTGSRQMDITLAFRALLTAEAGRHHQPSWYASRLHLSPAYLNEVVRSVTGMNVSRNILSELVLRAKRLLAHTDGSVKEIAAALGFDDPAYFSRLFTQTAGISPTAFRQRNLD